MKNELKTLIIILAMGLGQIPARAAPEKAEQLRLIRVPGLFLFGSQDDNKAFGRLCGRPGRTAMNAGFAEGRRPRDRYQHCGG